MRDDLLHAQASVDWAISNFPSLQDRTNTWIKANLYVGVENLDPQSTDNDILAVMEREPLPLSFTVEVGAYLNAIRSSLDILAVALATRHSISRPDEASFPVAKSEAIFLSRKNYKGAELVKGLPASEGAIIESLRPYSGGNDELYVLHNLDIVRKHKRLLAVEPNIGMVRLGPVATPGDFVPLNGGPMRANDKTVIGLLKRGAPKPTAEFSAYVALDESPEFEEVPLIPALYGFARMANGIIAAFDH